MTVPFLDVKAVHAELGPLIEQAMCRVARSGWYLLGPELAEFESEFAAYCETSHCVGVGSGADALELTLRALDVGRGDEVIVPSHTFIATWLAVSAVGATPVPVEPDERWSTMDPDRVSAAVTSRTRVIMPVHLYGHPADLEPIERVAERHGLAVVDDAAQAHGARYHGQRVGSRATATAFSFYPGKNLGALGDGGAVVTSDAALADRVRMLRNYGSRQKYRHEVRATNSRLDEVQAAALRVKLGHLDSWNARRRSVATRYRAELAGIEGITLPSVASWANPVWHLFVIRCGARDRLRELLSARGIDTLVHYPVPNHLAQAYADHGWTRGSFPRAESLAREVLSLPMGPHMPEHDVTSVVEAVRVAAGELPRPLEQAA
ncbi:DegT/DnrJ/EryC1/StrS family aminotransferase [Haloechinothrix sp. LS1_15]|uniref:DegT/DnrJ/EryC1/StrS family aminotransferase n=1 Tax=Haloechinothrix sp. LS1_15 TaxID=2652248 RepID=UPI00294504B2|nr:DegT/DnrJ/EryC1/StrS family aminotransferase [Haloechinothrix sp. LS1_15]MDV6011627.1 DegT/DnrJ/EryC1/StrS family aminotransferase [Haloechinothrix sp. LS1_15]